MQTKLEESTGLEENHGQTKELWPLNKEGVDWRKIGCAEGEQN